MTGKYADGVHYLMRHTTLAVALVAHHAGGDLRALQVRAGCAGAEGGPGLHHGDADPAGRGFAAAYRGGQQADHRRAAGEPGRRPGHDVLRAGRNDFHHSNERRHRLGQPEGLVRTQVRRQVGRCRRGLRVRDRRADQGCVRARVRAATDRRLEHDRWLRRLRAVARQRRHQGARSRGAETGCSGAAAQGAGERHDHVLGQRAADPHGTRPRESQAARRECRGRVRDTAKHFRRAVRQRLQSRGPRVPRAPAIRGRVPCPPR